MSSSNLKEKIVNKWGDEKVLETALLIVQNRVKVGVEFLRDDMNLIRGYQTTFVSGELMFSGEPIVFDWPMQDMPIPDAFKLNNPKEIN